MGAYLIFRGQPHTVLPFFICVVIVHGSAFCRFAVLTATCAVFPARTYPPRVYVYRQAVVTWAHVFVQFVVGLLYAVCVNNRCVCRRVRAIDAFITVKIVTCDKLVFYETALQVSALGRQNRQYLITNCQLPQFLSLLLT